MYRESRNELRQDYDAGEKGHLSTAELTYVQPALYGAYTEMSGGSALRPQRMLAEAKKAHRVIDGTLVELGSRVAKVRG